LARLDCENCYHGQKPQKIQEIGRGRLNVKRKETISKARWAIIGNSAK